MGHCLVFCFRHPEGTWENAVSQSTKTRVPFMAPQMSTSKNNTECFCHVDIAIHRTDEETWGNVFTTYSAYMGRDLSKTNLHENNYDPCKDVFLCLSVTEAEAITAREYLESLTAKPLPYNYKDLPMCLLPSRVVSLFTDVDCWNVTKAFCSQLAILVLRKSLSFCDGNDRIRGAIENVNSRSVSPNALFSILKPFCERIRVTPFVMGKVSVIRY